MLEVRTPDELLVLAVPVDAQNGVIVLGHRNAREGLRYRYAGHPFKAEHTVRSASFPPSSVAREGRTFYTRNTPWVRCRRPFHFPTQRYCSPSCQNASRSPRIALGGK